MGLLSRFSPVKIHRTEKDCSHCHSCTRHCPALIDVEGQETVKTAECFGCMTCVSRCPAKGALEVSFGAGEKRKAFVPYLYPAVLVIMFFAIVGAGIISGNWHSHMPYEEYQRLIPALQGLTHP